MFSLSFESFLFYLPAIQDTKRLESGIQFVNEAEIAGYLLECENILRQQVVDIQILLDGKFPFADQLVQRYGLMSNHPNNTAYVPLHACV